MSTASPSHSANVSAIPAGTRVGEFEVLSILGVGGFGIVYLAFDHGLEREVALKEYMPASLVGRTETMHVSLRSQADADTFALGLRSFVNEAKLLAKFDHPSLVKVHRFWEANGTAYMVMPVYRGRSLKAIRAEMAQPPDEAWLRALLMPLLGAIEVLHADGVFHRDIAPDNIQIEPNGRPVLLDFGAARRVITDRSQNLTAILKPAYAPIEQYGEADSVRQGPWTDIYALGATVYYLLKGQPPPASTTRAIHDDMVPLSAQALPGCSTGFLRCIDWMLTLRPTERPQSVAALRAALESAPTGTTTTSIDSERTVIRPPSGGSSGAGAGATGFGNSGFGTSGFGNTGAPGASTTGPGPGHTGPYTFAPTQSMGGPPGYTQTQQVPYPGTNFPATTAQPGPGQQSVFPQTQGAPAQSPPAQAAPAPAKRSSAVPVFLGLLVVTAAAVGVWKKDVLLPMLGLGAPAVVAVEQPVDPAAAAASAAAAAEAASAALAAQVNRSVQAALQAAAAASAAAAAELEKEKELEREKEKQREKEKAAATPPPAPAAKTPTQTTPAQGATQPRIAAPPSAVDNTSGRIRPPNETCGGQRGIAYFECVERECRRPEIPNSPTCEKARAELRRLGKPVVEPEPVIQAPKRQPEAAPAPAPRAETQVTPPAAAAPAPRVMPAPDLDSQRTKAPSETCGDKRGLPRFACVETECGRPQLFTHPECVELRAEKQRRGTTL